MANNIQVIVYPAKDLEKSKKFFNTFLGTEPYVDSEYYIGYRFGGLEFGLDPNGKDVISYIDTDGIEASLKTLKDVGGGLLIAQVEIDGSTVGLRQHPAK